MSSRRNPARHPPCDRDGQGANEVDHTVGELLGLAASAGVPAAAVIREARPRALPAMRREIERNTAGASAPEVPE